MAIDSLLFFSGTEIGNNARTAAYLKRGGRASLMRDCTCSTLPAAIADPPYQSPEIDGAPWYDPTEPRSARFGGLWIESIDGLKTSPYQRKVTERVGDGAVRSMGRRNSKTLTVTGWLFATDCCAADFGLQWLTAALYSACTTCTGNDLCLLSCCPSVVPADTEGADQGPDGRWYDTRSQLRTLTGAALISGPTVTQRARGCAADCSDSAEGFRPLYRVQFVLNANPCVWREPIPVLDQTLWPLPTGNEPCNVVFTQDCCDLANPGCPCAPPCAADEKCPAPAPPPTPPPAVPACICVPLQIVRQSVDIPETAVPTWEEGSLTVTVRAGAQAMRNLTINVWPNLLDRDPADLSDCNVCGRYYVTHIPENSTLTIDGRTCTAILECPGQVTTDASDRVYGSAGGPVQCLTISCGIRYTVAADVDILSVAPDASLSVSVVRCEATA